MKKKQIRITKELEINGLYCKKCNEIIYSRAHYDYRSCTCGNCSVDGGFDYFRRGIKYIKEAQHVNLKLPITKQALYKDWNEDKDKLGKIKFEILKEDNNKICWWDKLKDYIFREKVKNEVEM